ncbi:hypothetical protein WL1483_65 [Aeromonas schubertii]|uniref:Uncharacterized protein n=1 Tax=Aeromonas schubertii TaxID=652 RepID=A0A0S2SCR8_9GAMM|nr:hypothetical protein WL1483_65 [Aeromonas schubertii]
MPFGGQSFETGVTYEQQEEMQNIELIDINDAFFKLG